MDDFVRNFMVRMGLTGTPEKFETEWYEMEATGKLNKEDMGAVPDVYNYNQELNDQCVALRLVVNAQAVVEKATSTWEKFRKERDVHRMHHKRIGQEKNKLLGDIKKLRKHYAQYEPTIKELKRKYELAMKEKMLVRIEGATGFSPSSRRSRWSRRRRPRRRRRRPGRLPRKRRRRQRRSGRAAQAAMDAARRRQRRPRRAIGEAERLGSARALGAHAPQAARLPRRRRTPGAKGAGGRGHERSPEPVPVENFKLSKTFKGHQMSVSNIGAAPRKSILATASDDATWKMWDLPNGNLIMSGDGHKDWVAGVGLPPRRDAPGVGVGGLHG